MSKIHQELFEKNLIDTKQVEFIEAVTERKIISVYYELRLVLYLGIMLFTAGVGYIAYQNLGDIGHLGMMALLLLAIGACGYYISKKSLPYSNEEVKVNHIYFDYILILTSLLIIALFTYVQVYFQLIELFLNWTSIISAIIFLTLAYRYDNKAVLSLGITALAATFGLTISPVNWVSGDWLPGLDLYLTSIIFGLSLIGLSEVLSRKGIKKHFTFTYQNFGLLIYYAGIMALLFDFSWEVMIAFILLFSASAISYYTWAKKEFLLFLYSSIAAYVGFTYLLVRLLTLGDSDGIVLLVYYFPISCIAYVLLLVKNKNHFSDDE